MPRHFNNEAVQGLGFRDKEEFFALVSDVDLRLLVNQRLFTTWQHGDGTKAGLLLVKKHIASLGIIDRALEQYKLKRFYALFSGGHDSLVATHVSSYHHAFSGVIHIDTETGIPETRQFVEETCKRNGWTLYTVTPTEAKQAGYKLDTYEEIIQKMGMPGAAFHGNVYKNLKDKPLRLVKRQLEPNRKWLLTTGVRLQESDRRMGTAQEMRELSSTIWANPILHWTALECNAYIRLHQLPRNMVKDTMHISGECFCGCFAQAEELRMLDIFYPQQASRIRAWQDMARDAGHPERLCKWGERTLSDDQMELFPLCHYCRGNSDTGEA